ncbi:MAG: hypothetical protein QM652_13815 [Legionella sp.]|uniref:hypothetical protein n=1 Tax=Legionella sp. TaxID=459 RepID=UPI0039E3013D
MSLEMFHWTLAIYIAGLFISVLGSIQFLLNRDAVKKNMGMDLFQAFPDLSAYHLIYWVIILKPIFWPYFFVTQKSPIERISELFFKHYGDEGHTYFGDPGIKNFFRDVVKGKNRYKSYQKGRLIWFADKDGSDYQEYKKYFSGKSEYVEIIYAYYQDQYLLGVMWGSKECLSADKPISRFELDQCESMNASQFKQRLLQINHVKAAELFSQFKEMKGV